jgi:hypothetical protein
VSLGDGQEQLTPSGQATNIAALRKVLEAGNAVALVGAGPSSEAGMPRWAGLVEELCAACGVPYRTGDELPELAKNCREKNFQAYTSTLQRLFDTAKYSTPQAYTAIAKCKFQAYLTFNFDRLLDYLVEKKHHTLPALWAENIRDGGVFHLHGMVHSNAEITSWADLVLAADDFERAYIPNGQLVSFLIQVLTNRPAVLIGLSLRDGYSQRVFQECLRLLGELKRARPGTGHSRPGHHHFAVLNQYDDVGLFVDAGMKIIRYDFIDGQHSLAAFLRMHRLSDEPQYCAGMDDGDTP